MAQQVDAGGWGVGRPTRGMRFGPNALAPWEWNHSLPSPFVPIQAHSSPTRSRAVVYTRRRAH